MNVNFEKHLIINLVKLNLKTYNLSKRVGLSLILFLIILYKVISRLNTFGIENNLNVNFWDGVFRVLSYPMLFLGLYFPFVIIITFLSNHTKNNYITFIMIRTNKKITWIISKIIISLILSLVFVITFFLSIFTISYIFFGFSSNWSDVILNPNSLKLVPELYVNSFVFQLTPIKAYFISFFEIYLCTTIIINFRDILINYIPKAYIANLILSGYLFFNMICNGYNLNDGIFILSNYIGLDTMSLIWHHKFYNFNYYKVTLTQSLIISLLLLIILIVIDLVMNRKLVVDHD
ncbi:hypothetical protein [Clostridium sp. BJN0013]|uniref:hypothetical protein n=1 Tax=Clostridium sp. BJN0013 TaxID=3236840 RepID=UPI0034C5F16E